MVLANYCFSKRQKDIVNKGSKGSREGQTLEDPISSKIIWKASSYDPQGGSMEVVVPMGAFVGSNYDFVSILEKEVDEDREKHMKL